MLARWRRPMRQRGETGMTRGECSAPLSLARLPVHETTLGLGWHYWAARDMTKRFYESHMIVSQGQDPVGKGSMRAASKIVEEPPRRGQGRADSRPSGAEIVQGLQRNDARLNGLSRYGVMPTSVAAI